ncbi:hypothetical protein GCM10017612_15090 [Novosphingobium resinovorum]|nr:hypothetical protein GCM10017612_15090 [Novosphingobium resinovorum]
MQAVEEIERQRERDEADQQRQGKAVVHEVKPLASSLRGGETDEAIQACANRPGLLRYARNDEEW